MDTKKYAWYSEKQIKSAKEIKENNPEKKKAGVYKIYLNDRGEEIRASMVSPTMEHGCRWDDMEYLGEVFKYLRSED